jgi:hypothetical protein
MMAAAFGGKQKQQLRAVSRRETDIRPFCSRHRALCRSISSMNRHDGATAPVVRQGLGT